MSGTPSNNESDISVGQKDAGTQTPSLGKNERVRAWLQSAAKARSESPVGGTCLMVAQKDIKFLKDERLKLEEMVLKREASVERQEPTVYFSYPTLSRPAAQLDFD